VDMIVIRDSFRYDKARIKAERVLDFFLLNLKILILYTKKKTRIKFVYLVATRKLIIFRIQG